MSFDPPPMSPLAASLASRLAHESRIRSEAKRKTSPRNKTASAAITTPMHEALHRLAIKLGTTRAHAIEVAIEQLCAKHGIEIETEPK